MSVDLGRELQRPRGPAGERPEHYELLKDPSKNRKNTKNLPCKGSIGMIAYH